MKIAIIIYIFENEYNNNIGKIRNAISHIHKILTTPKENKFAIMFKIQKYNLIIKQLNYFSY